MSRNTPGLKVTRDRYAVIKPKTDHKLLASRNVIRNTNCKCRKKEQ